jgi:hypothetical protein
VGSLIAFKRVEQLIDISETAIQELVSEWKAFNIESPLNIVSEVEAETGVTVFKLVLTREIPVILERRAIEALNNLKNAFDQMVFSTGKAIGRPVKERHYPWTDSPRGLEIIRNSKGNGKVPPEVWDEIERQAPYSRGDNYPGGDDLVREMARLANDKHTIGLAILPAFRRNVQRVQIDRMVGNALFESAGLPYWDPVKKEAVLARSGGATDLKASYQISLYITFDVPISAIDAPTALEALLKKAKDSLEGFKALAVRLGAT